jgi:hypothetical protein
MSSASQMASSVPVFLMVLAIKKALYQRQSVVLTTLILSAAKKTAVTTHHSTQLMAGGI